jgi:hypothetical protein
MYSHHFSLCSASVQPLSLQDRTEMARDRLGLATWEELEPAEQRRLIEREVWRREVHEAWLAERAAEEAKRLGKLRGKGGKDRDREGARRRRGRGAAEQEDSDDGFIE